MYLRIARTCVTPKPFLDGVLQNLAAQFIYSQYCGFIVWVMHSKSKMTTLADTEPFQIADAVPNTR